ncbi:hypothetical protein T484DRAFT_1852875 [Baffinella frigidus]|nr:hypothetical protein T484DRAFT_1852875 [Cryptophyta sp. CCMP2293]
MQAAPGARRLEDTWEFNPDTMAWTQLETKISPPARNGHAMTAAGGSLYLFGGFDPQGSDLLNDFWMLDLKADQPSWHQISPPPPRSDHLLKSENTVLLLRIETNMSMCAAAIHPSGRTVTGLVLFGGSDWAGQLDDLWEWSSSDGWQEVRLQGKPVPHRYEEGLVGANGKAYFFGGDDWQTGFLWDLWKYDPSNKQLRKTTGFQRDLWEYDPSNKQLREIGTFPDGRYARGILGGADPKDSSIFLFGSWGTTDHNDSSIFLFGSWGTTGTQLDEQWELDTTSAIYRDLSYAPPTKATKEGGSRNWMGRPRSPSPPPEL